MCDMFGVVSLQKPVNKALMCKMLEVVCPDLLFVGTTAKIFE